MVRVKICGIRRVDDALLAAEYGADAIGLMFYPQSPRGISIAQAVSLLKALPPFLTTVGVFVNPSVDEVRAVIEQVPLSVLQFHGEESEAFCRQFPMPYIKVLRVKAGSDMAASMAHYPSAAAFLLDTYHAHVYGGTGEVFDWSLIPSSLTKPLIVAGGLTANNVLQAVQQVKPYAVDVSSGVEASPGIKDKAKLQRFMEAVLRHNHLP